MISKKEFEKLNDNEKKEYLDKSINKTEKELKMYETLSGGTGKSAKYIISSIVNDGEEFEKLARETGGIEINISAENHSSINVFEMAKEADDAIVARLNEIDKKKCRFGANVEELEKNRKN